MAASAPAARRRSLRTQLAVSFALLTAVPAVGAVLLVVERAAQQRRAGMEERLRETSAALCRGTDEFLASHLGGVVTLAAGISATMLGDTLAEDQRLGAFHETYPSFVNALLADAQGNILSMHPLAGPDGTPFRNLRANVRERLYFHLPMATGRPYVSNAFRGRAPGGRTLIAASAPILGPDGRPIGLAAGTLGPTSFAELGRGFESPSAINFVIADAGGTVVYASAGDPEPLTPIRETVLRAGAGDTTFSYTRDAVPYLVRTCRTTLDWTVYIRQPLTSLNRDVRHQYRLGLAWVALSLLGATLIARRLARYFTRPLDALVVAVQGFQGEREPVPVATPTEASEEVAQLISDFEEMARRVAHSHRTLQGALEERALLADALRETVEEREAEIAARTAELVTANQALERLAQEDPLTGLANRRELMVCIERAWSAALREQQSVSLLMVDVDCFKQFNDRYGHQEGDAALRAVARQVGDLARRPLDVAGRYGGEEFALLLHGTDLEGAEEMAERLRTAVLALAVPHDTSTVASVITVSVGAASAVPDLPFQWQRLITEADQALYAAKEGGRNRVCLAQRDPA